MKTDTANSKIFVSIIEDLTHIVEQLKLDNKHYNEVILDNEDLYNKVEKLEHSNWCKDISIYFLLTLGISHYIFL